MLEEEYDLRRPEELTAVRRVRLLWAAGVLVLLLGLAVWFGAHPTAHAIKAWQSRRDASAALRLIGEQEWADAQAKVQDALALDPTGAAAIQAAARFVTRVGNFREGTDLWEKLAAKRPLAQEDHRDYAMALLGIGKIAGAEEELRQAWPNRAQGTSADWALGLQLALSQGRAEEAKQLALRLVDSNSATERQRLNAAVLLLSSGPEETHARAWATVRAIALSDKSEALEAIELLARRAAAAIIATRQGQPTGNPPMLLSELMPLLEKPDDVTFRRGIIARELHLIEDPSRYAAIIREAVEKAQKASPEQLLSICGWLVGKREFAKVLDLLPMEKAAQSRELFLLRLDSLAGLGRWPEVEDTVKSQRFSLEPVTQEMYLARCSDQLGEKETAQTHWRAAVAAAGSNVRQLLQIAQYAEKSGATAAAESAYRNAIKITPDSRTAHESFLRLAQAQRDTKKIREVLAGMLQVWPGERAVQNDVAYLDLLLRQNIDAARETAERLVKADPDSLPHRTTLALAELRLGHPHDGLEVFHGQTDLPAGVLPRVSAVHAAILGELSYPEKAKAEAAALNLSQLLPEEAALIAPLISTPPDAATKEASDKAEAQSSPATP